ncbi:hypothetical protein D3C81_1112110 [compost metagenome]
MGGPIKNPRNAIVEISVNEFPALMALCLPATPYTVGTLQELPKPMTIKAIVHSTTVG